MPRGRFTWLERDVNGDGNPRMLSVIQVVTVVHIVDIDIVGPVPDWRPSLWARINHIEPEASELETRRTFDHNNRDVVDTKPVSTAKIGTETIWWNAVSMVAPAFVPGAVLVLPIVSTLSLPNVLSHIARWLGPSHLVQLCGTMVPVLGTPLDCFVVFVPLLRSCITFMLGRTLVLVTVLIVAFMPVRSACVIFSTVLCVGECCAKQQG